VNEQIKIIGEVDIPYNIWRTNFGKGSRPDKDILVDRKIFAAKKLGDLRDQRAVITLVAVLNDNVYGVARLDPTSKAQIMAEATEALGKIGGPDAVAQLTKMLDAELPKRKMAAKAFRHLRGREAGVELILRLSGEPDLDVKADIAFALGEIGPNLAAGPLANLMAGELIKVLGGIKTTSQNWLLGNTIKSLGKFKDKRATKPLLDILLDRRDNEAILNLGIEALGMIGDPDAADFLDTWLRLSPSSSIRTAAADALGAIGAKAGGKIALEKLRKRLDSNLEKDPRVLQAIKKALRVP
jgi:HEAT repeat protein